MQKSIEPTLVAEPTTEEPERLSGVLTRIGGPHVAWGGKEVLDLWIVEHRAQLDQKMSAQIRVNSWALVIATFGLVLCTGGLIWATFAA
ncbi:hypothetical protein [Plantibacter sp. CFBP 8775]|uniref:hypothetical protein n=1 Tax=Plantibacter sp. CFBP 8775 TaxID=2774038 RepID=UPI0017848EA7|nr:hypothetical protein [Plantibacter sp. CFBP 8775]MBD8102287.1 hypothetical protein [Plantibacter sp. CFBP 8775]